MYLLCYYIIEEVMEQSIIKIGNSKGLRLSKSILERYQIKDKVEVILEEGQIIIKPIDEPRKGWDQAFKKMNENGDDQLLIDDVFEDEFQDL
ncbi:AbrB/MazE/SpoVT family DNA-binding domain-containing protein [soil metagenome]